MLALQGCRQLEKLRMGGVIDGRGLSVDHRHDSVLFPLRGAACLKALDLRDCQGVTDSLLGHIVAGCPQMEQLRLSNTCIKVQVSGQAGRGGIQPACASRGELTHVAPGQVCLRV